MKDVGRVRRDDELRPFVVFMMRGMPGERQV